MPINYSPRDWATDNGHEDGNYSCLCCQCGWRFIGNKHRKVCFVCDKSNRKTFHITRTLRTGPQGQEGNEMTDRRTTPRESQDAMARITVSIRSKEAHFYSYAKFIAAMMTDKVVAEALLAGEAITVSAERKEEEGR